MDDNSDDLVIPEKYRDPNEASRIYFLPNAFTAGNLFFGFWAIISCIDAQYNQNVLPAEGYMRAVWCILLSCVCDALDGRVARIGNRVSLFGAEFDSLADVVSFGLAPTMMMIFLVMSPARESYQIFTQLSYIIGFIYLLCAAVRLARFNVITSPLLPINQKSGIASKDFVGLPVPAAAGMVASLVLLNIEYQNTLPKFISLALPFFLLLIAYLMVSKIPYPSFKKVALTTKGEIGTFIFAFVSLIICAFIFKYITFSILFLYYIMYGIFRHIIRSIRTYRSRNKENNNPDNSL